MNSKKALPLTLLADFSGNPDGKGVIIFTAWITNSGVMVENSIAQTMRKLVNAGVSRYLRHHLTRINDFRQRPFDAQQRWWKMMVEAGRWTSYGKAYQMREIRNQSDFSKFLPIVDYEGLQPYIQRSMYGEKDVLWPGYTRWFAKSSGTTSNQSKFIPVTKDNLRNCHIKGNWDALALYYNNRPDARIFECKSLIMGGSLNHFEPYPTTRYGDISAIMIHQMPNVGKPFRTPDLETALMSEWEEKIERMARITSKEKNLVLIGGVPTWTIVLIRRIMEMTGAKDMAEVWPNLQVYFHGGVSFSPYKELFSSYFPQGIDFMEIYNATEGYFGIKDTLDRDDMLLLLDNGIYYEFLPMEEWGRDNPQAIPLEDVKKNVNYAMVISTNAGLWRYMPGDSIMFTDTRPYRFKITGRTKQFINSFGEEVMVSNTDHALVATCKATNAMVAEYTVAPCYFDLMGKGRHEWLIEFEKPPQNLIEFERLLDLNLQEVNSDYQAKRYRDMAMSNLTIQSLKPGSFIQWMRSRGKFGGQNKIPRLANHRQIVDSILDFAQANS